MKELLAEGRPSVLTSICRLTGKYRVKVPGRERTSRVREKQLLGTTCRVGRKGEEPGRYGTSRVEGGDGDGHLDAAEDVPGPHGYGGHGVDVGPLDGAIVVQTANLELGGACCCPIEIGEADLASSPAEGGNIGGGAGSGSAEGSAEGGGTPGRPASGEAPPDHRTTGVLGSTVSVVRHGT
ncbi:hypothetical protein BYT27DRAFT_7260410 [Phlegmacium glaucopus]|nr:hypothetical protein BYT27DRAFT_7260410 [Phlegmacium glaucopus]